MGKALAVWRRCAECGVKALENEEGGSAAKFFKSVNWKKVSKLYEAKVKGGM